MTAIPENGGKNTDGKEGYGWLGGAGGHDGLPTKVTTKARETGSPPAGEDADGSKHAAYQRRCCGGVDRGVAGRQQHWLKGITGGEVTAPEEWVTV